MPRDETPETGVPSISGSIAALDAKIKLIAQRIKIIENNEQVIGRTLVTINKKMKELEGLVASAGGKPVDLSAMKESLKEEIKSELSMRPEMPLRVEEASEYEVARKTRRASEDLENLKKQIENLSASVSEMKYILDTINPMEYVTLENLSEILDRKIDEKLRKKKKPTEEE